MPEDTHAQPGAPGRVQGESGAERWRVALAKALAVLAAAVVGFGFIPDRLVDFLTTRVSPDVRDALVTAWMAALVVLSSWGFVWLQRKRRG